MSTEDVPDIDAELDRRIAERFAAAREADRLEAETLTERLENQRTTPLSELGRENERRRVEAAAKRRRQQEERGRRYDQHLARVQAHVDRLVAEIAELDGQEQAERERSAAALAALTRRKVELAREIAALQAPPADDVSPEPPTARARLRALVGGHS